MAGRRGGRKPASHSLKVLRGDAPGTFKATVTSLPPAVPDKPSEVSADPVANETWDWLIGILGDRETLTLGDREVLAAFCLLKSRIAAARADVTRSGLTVMNDKGDVRKNPALVALESAEKELRLLMVELGLTPASRNRVKAEPQSSEHDSLEALLSGAS